MCGVLSTYRGVSGEREVVDGSLLQRLQVVVAHGGRERGHEREDQGDEQEEDDAEVRHTPTDA